MPVGEWMCRHGNFHYDDIEECRCGQVLSDAWDKGVDARDSGLQLSDNPYTPGTDEHEAWEDGFKDGA